MTKVYLIKLSGGGDIEEKFVDQEAWDWITSNDMGQGPQDIGASCWDDQLVPASIRAKIQQEYREFREEYGEDLDDVPAEVMLTSGSWDNDRALICPENVSIDKSKLDWGAIRDSLMAQGFEYTGEVYEGCIY